MSERVGKNMITTAKAVSLLDYLKDCHLDLIKTEGKYYARLREDSSIVIDDSGYHANNDNRHSRHDSIDFLMKYFDMTFQEAVRELCEYADGNVSVSTSKPHFLRSVIKGEHKREKARYAPPPVSDSKDAEKQIFQYLKKRGIERTKEINSSVKPTQQYGFIDIMFISRECNYGELRSAFDPEPPAKPFKGKFTGSDEDGYFIVGDTAPDTIYVCEAAIDALSLQILYDFEYKSAFASIGGVRCKAAIERLQRNYPEAEIVIAFDNDEAGNAAAEEYSFKRHVPILKDWNEDLLASIQSAHGSMR